MTSARAAARLPAPRPLPPPPPAPPTLREVQRQRADELTFAVGLSAFGAVRVGPRRGVDGTSDWEDDGCSIPLRDYSPPLSVLNRYFRASCERHDFGYRNVGKGLALRRDEATRERVDAVLRSDMRAQSALRCGSRRAPARAARRPRTPSTPA